MLKETLNKPSKSMQKTIDLTASIQNSRFGKFTIKNIEMPTNFNSGTRVAPDSRHNYPACRGRVIYKFASAGATYARVAFFAKPR